MNRLSPGILPTIVVLGALSAGPAQAQRGLKDVPKPDVARELKEFRLGEGLEINLFASDPWIAKPIQINWDPAGRLWVASSKVYPQLKPGQKPEDEIVVLEDTDGDGVADKRTVFAEKLLIPTGVLPGDGGAYVANSTEIRHYRDEDGDGVADKSSAVLSGFGTEDTHHIIHTFRWGPDGRFYFNQSVYIHSHIETPFGPRSLGGGGIWQFRPENQRLEVFCRGFVNTWGHVFDDYGQSLCTDGAYGEGVNHAFPESSFVWAVGINRTLKGMSPGQPKHCGLEILSGRHFPEEFQGNAVANDFRGNRVNRFALRREGSTFSAQQLPDIVASTNVAFRPVDVRVGPDGALYIADWYNPIIQHGEVDFRDPRRDHAHGRIWRITAKGRKPLPKPKLVGVEPQKLVEALAAPERWTREQARVELRRHNPSAVSAAIEGWLAALSPRDPQLERYRLEALWAAQTVDAPAIELLKLNLAAKDDRIRGAALRTAVAWRERFPDLEKTLIAAARDRSPTVRREAVTGLHAIGTTAAIEAAHAVLEKEMDSHLDYALWTAARATQAVWLPDVKNGVMNFGGDAKKLLFALRACESAAALDPLVEMMDKNRIAATDMPKALELFASFGDAERLGAVLKRALSQKPEDRGPYLDALETAARQRKVVPAGDTGRILDLTGEADPAAAPALRLAGHWKAPGAPEKLKAVARNQQAASPLRIASIEGLGFLGSPEAKQELASIATSDLPPQLRTKAVGALAAIDLPQGAKLAAEILPGVESEADLSSLVDDFLRHGKGPEELAGALAGKTLPTAKAETLIRRAGTAGRDVSGLVRALRIAGKAPEMRTTLSPAERTELLDRIAKSADPARGEDVYRRDSLQCMKCHSIAGTGGVTGPDLISLGASAPVDYIVEAMLEPSKKIKEGYHSVMVKRDDGGVATGLLVARTEAELRLRNADGELVVIPAAAVESVKQSTVSLMPQDLLKGVTTEEFADLVKFLSVLGKEGGYKPPSAGLVRRWRVLVPEKGKEALPTRMSVAALLEAPPGVSWKPAYGTVAGALPLASMPQHFAFMGAKFSFLRFGIEMTSAGKIGLKFADPVGLKLRVGDAEVPLSASTELTLPRGTRELTLVVDRVARTTPVSVEVFEPASGAGRGKPVTGP